MLIVVLFAALLAGCCPSHRINGDKQMFAHNVYFSLSDASEAKKIELVGECHTYLKNHPGVVFFAAGTVSPDHNRKVNDRDFDVALHIIFDSASSQDTYQAAADHQAFIERNKDNWKQVRVFDSLVE